MMDTNTAPTAPKPKYLWGNIFFMALTPLVSIIAVPWYIATNGWSWGLFALFLINFAINNITITAGYHRYFSHNSYEAHPIVRWLFMFIGTGAFEGSVLQWASDHRRHHRYVDTDRDPYNIHNGFLYAHLTWMFREDPTGESKVYAKDLLADRWLVLQHKYYAPAAFFVGFFLPAIIGLAFGLPFWGSVLFGGILRVVFTQHTTFLINSWAHTIGRQTYTDKHTARDSLWLALFTFGEGYHNYHHTFQADYRNGVRWYQWDPTKWLIALLASLGLASRLKKAQKEEILRTRLAMEEKLMLAKGASFERVKQLKARIEEAQKRLKQLRESYRLAKQDLAAKGREWKFHMRTEIRMAEIEFRSAYGQWRTFRRAMNRSASAAA